MSVEIGEPYEHDELTPLDHWLTARWVVFRATRRGLRHTRAWHPPWPLHRARALHVRDELVPAAGLRPIADPLVHYSPGVPVRIGPPAPEAECRVRSHIV